MIMKRIQNAEQQPEDRTVILEIDAESGDNVMDRPPAFEDIIEDKNNNNNKNTNNNNHQHLLEAMNQQNCQGNDQKKSTTESTAIMKEAAGEKPSINSVNQEAGKYPAKDVDEEPLRLPDFVLARRQSILEHHNPLHHHAAVEIGRDNYVRTLSMVSYMSGVEEEEMMTNRYKYITTGVLCFCYFALAINDYIFGPTFDDLSKILGVSLSQVSLFATIRQFSYTAGALGGYAFNYINRQLALITLLFLSAVTLVVTPFAPSLAIFFIIAIINGFAAGAADIGFHVWILEMFEDGGGPLLQALHFAFGMGTIVAPSITGPFLSESEGACLVNHSEISAASSEVAPLYIPYSLSALILVIGGVSLTSLFLYKKYVPPKEEKIPQAFQQQMPASMSKYEKFLVFKESLPSFYTATVIAVGSTLILAYYGLEVTYFQFVAPFVTATPGVSMTGHASANVEAALAGAYALCGFISIYLSTKLVPQQMLYFNFLIMDCGALILLIIGKDNELFMWIGNILVGAGFSSTYASVYTFLEHQISVTNTIGSIFLFTGGLGTALFPILISHFICTNSLILVYLCLACAQISMGLFFVLHIMTWIRSKQVDMVKNSYVKASAILIGYRERTMSKLSALSGHFVKM